MHSSARDKTKATLQRIGLFPAARSAYRALHGGIRKQRAHEIAFYSSLFSPGALCFDIGANLGQTTEVFLACGARVLSVEPNALCHPTLKHLFGENKNCQIVQSAIGSSNGFIDLHVHGTDATASVRADWDRQTYGSDRGTTATTTPIATLDTLIERYGRPDFVKIDVEGFEKEVLRGLSSSVRLLSFEFHFTEIGLAEECLEMLDRFGVLSIRASDMDCNWLTSRTDDIKGSLRMLHSTNAKGDLFVWMS
jgi:FkbM family methyltransferase